VLNKIDCLEDRARLDALLSRYPHAVAVSARSGLGLDRLAAAVSDALSRGFLDIEIEAPVGDGRLMAYLAAHGEVLSRRFGSETVLIHCRLPQERLHVVERSGAVVRRLTT